MFDYNQQDRFVFYKHKCNIRLALMLFKRFLFPQHHLLEMHIFSSIHPWYAHHQGCHIHWKVYMMWRYHLVAQYWVHQVSSVCPTTPENETGQSNSGAEMSIYTSIVQAETVDMKDFKWTSARYTLSISPKVMIKQSWHKVILGIKTAPIFRG